MLVNGDRAAVSGAEDANGRPPRDASFAYLGRRRRCNHMSQIQVERHLPAVARDVTSSISPRAVTGRRSVSVGWPGQGDTSDICRPKPSPLFFFFFLLFFFFTILYSKF